MDQVKEQIKFYTELLRAVIVMLLASISGGISFVQKTENFSPSENYIVFLAIVIIFILLLATTFFTIRILQLIKKL
ncbi:MAG: hypothetical protein ACO1NW_16210 [Chitinophagaceae bacterium]